MLSSARFLSFSFFFTLDAILEKLETRDLKPFNYLCFETNNCPASIRHGDLPNFRIEKQFIALTRGQ